MEIQYCQIFWFNISVVVVVAMWVPSLDPQGIRWTVYHTPSAMSVGY